MKATQADTQQTTPVAKLPSEMTYEELLSFRQKVMYEKEDLEAAMTVINQEILLRLQEEKTSGKVVGNWGISKAVRYSFKTTLMEARALGAVKEDIDTKVLKDLVLKGVEVPGTNRVEYIIVREVEKNGK